MALSAWSGVMFGPDGEASGTVMFGLCWYGSHCETWKLVSGFAVFDV